MSRRQNDGERITLAEYSNKLVDKAIERQNKRRKRIRDQLEKGSSFAFNDQHIEDVSNTKRGAGNCGTVAIDNDDERRAQKEKEKETNQAKDSEDEAAPEWEDIGPAESESLSLDYASNGDEEEESDKITIDVDIGDSEFFTDRKNLREWALQVHRLHLLCLIGRGLHINGTVKDALIQGKVLSTIPLHLLPRADSSKLSSLQIRPMTKYFSRAFKVQSSSDVKKSFEDSMHDALKSKTGTAEEIVALFAALCNALGLMTRLVCVLEPVTRQSKKALLSYKTQMEKSEEAKMAVKASAADSGKDGPSAGKGKHAKKRALLKEINKANAKGKIHLPKFWVEVCFHDHKSTSGMLWESIDPISGEMGRSDSFEKLKIRRKPLTYVVAFLGKGVKDVTQRYAMNFLLSSREMDESWWEETLNPLKTLEAEAILEHVKKSDTSLLPNSKALKRTEEEMALDCQLREDTAMSERALKQLKANWPKTLTAAKNHPYYVLQRYLNKNQILAPWAKFTGKFLQSEPLYLRADVCELRSADTWLRLGKQVEESELDKPLKVIPTRSTKNSSSSNPTKGDTDKSNGTALFGEWQTMAYVPPVAENGKVPRNEYGNVVCPPLVPTLPTGVVKLSFPRIGKICKQLHVDYAPAVVGFERRSGRFTPSVDGVVICEEYQAMVLQQYLEEETKKAELERQRKHLQIRRAWRTLLLTLKKRALLRREYSTEAGTLPPAPSMTPVSKDQVDMEEI